MKLTSDSPFAAFGSPKALLLAGKTELWIVKGWRSNQPALCNSQTKFSWRHTHWWTLLTGLSSTALFINKSHVTYSCLNFPLKGCFLNIYKKHVSQKRRITGKDFLWSLWVFQQRHCFWGQHRKNTPPHPFHPRKITRELSENCSYSHLKLVPGLLTLGSVDSCFYVSYCKTIFYVNWQLWGFRNKATNPKQDKLLLKFMWNNWKQNKLSLKNTLIPSFNLYYIYKEPCKFFYVSKKHCHLFLFSGGKCSISLKLYVHKK